VLFYVCLFLLCVGSLFVCVVLFVFVIDVVVFIIV